MASPRRNNTRPDQEVFERLLILPPPHSEPQSRLINAWKLRYDPVTDPLAQYPFYDPDYPSWDLLPLFNTHLRYVAGACGTKFGKTYGSTIWMADRAWANLDPVTGEPLPDGLGKYWWVAPTYEQAENAYDAIKRLFHPDTIRSVGRPKYKIFLLNADGSDRCVVEFKSGDNPDGLRGFGVHGFVLDEAARGMREEAMTSIETTTTMTQGVGIVISTPNGKGWFFERYKRGIKFYPDGTPRFNADSPDPYPEWFSVQMPTHMNPHVKLREVEMKRRQLSETDFRMEYLAEFIDDSGLVFKKIDKAERGSLEEPVAGEGYVLAADLAKLKDYTVITVMRRSTRHVVFQARFNRTEWEWQKMKIVEVAKKYNHATIVVDSTGVGDAIYEDLTKSGLHVIPYKISGPEPKRLLIERLRVNLENERITFPKGSRQCPSLYQTREELENYEMKFNATTGRISYSAPSGQHDDCVISLALAIFVVDQPTYSYSFKQIRGI